MKEYCNNFMEIIGFTMFYGILGYFLGLLGAGALKSAKVYREKDRYVSTTGTVELIYYSWEVTESQRDLQNPQIDFEVFSKSRYQVDGQDYWETRHLSYGGVPHSIEDVIKITDRYSPGQPVAVSIRSITKPAYEKLFNKNYHLDIKKKITIKYDPKNPNLTTTTIAPSNLKSLGVGGGLVLTMTLILLVGSFFLFRENGVVFLTIMLLTCPIGLSGGAYFALRPNQEKAEHSKEEETPPEQPITQDNPGKSIVVFHKNMTKPESPQL